jgi:streptogramin lyase
VTEIPRSSPESPVIYRGFKSDLWGQGWITSDPLGDVWVASSSGSIIEIPRSDPKSPVVFAGNGAEELSEASYDIASDSFGDIWVADGLGDSLTELSRLRT